MTIKKSELYRSLWASCDELRGGMDASQYKDYILTLLFVKYVSDRYADDRNALIDIPEGGSFSDIWALKGTPNIGEGIDKVIARLAAANDLQNVINVAYFNDPEKLGDGKEMVDRLSSLVTIFQNLEFGSNRADGDDLLGDAYEYLMRHFATESGKSKGQFYTPAEVSRILAKVVGIGSETKANQSVYDPTCGSGSLLLKAADEAPNGMSVYGQEKDVATWALAKMNMILHGCETAEIERGNTIASPKFASGSRLKLHDFIVANPPFSDKTWSSGINPNTDQFERFEYGIPPAKNGDYAFLLHAIKSLKSTGKAAMILPHGVLFRGNTEATIRRSLLKNRLIKGVIGLPANLFYGTGIPACIVVIDKEHAAERKSVFLVDASKGFAKDGNKNRLRAQDIHKIVDTFNSQVEIEGYSRLVPLSEIADLKNDYNLNIPRYIDSSALEDLQDIDSHLHGGIPERDLDRLSDYWAAFPSLRAQLFEADRKGYFKARIEPAAVQQAIEANAEFHAFKHVVAAKIDDWWAAYLPVLSEVKEGTAPKPIIHEMSEAILKQFAAVPLLSRYDVYEQLMDYWAETMQDDAYIISSDGWIAAAKPRAPLADTERKLVEEPDLVIGSGRSAKKYKMDLIPPSVVKSRYFAAEQQALEELQLDLVRATQELEEYVEEHGVEGGLLEDIVNDKGKATKATVASQIKELRGDRNRADELEAAVHCGELLEIEATAKKAVKEVQQSFDVKTLARYTELIEDEIKQLVIGVKWIVAIRAAVDGEVGHLARCLVTRVTTLEKRYEHTLSELESDTDELGLRVKAHLSMMEHK